MRRLIPEPVVEVSVPDLVSELRPWDEAHAERPYVTVNFALTLDGATAIDGTSGKIGSDRDTEMLVWLRTRADAIMIGAGTLRAEGYGRIIKDPAKRELRADLGLSPDPLMVIVSGSFNVDWGADLFTDPGGPVVIFTGAEGEVPQGVERVEVVRHENGVDLPAALGHLRSEHGVRALHCEGGGRLHASLHEVGAIDELFITHAPKLVGGEAPGLLEGLPAGTQDLELAWLVHEPDTGELFARYRVPRGG
jgi:riboflavin-specific deaminase-like protein